MHDLLRGGFGYFSISTKEVGQNLSADDDRSLRVVTGVPRPNVKWECTTPVTTRIADPIANPSAPRAKKTGAESGTIK